MPTAYAGIQRAPGFRIIVRNDGPLPILPPRCEGGSPLHSVPLIPAVSITRANFSLSRAKKSRNASGVLATTTMPS